MKLEEEVKEDIARLLAMVCTDNTDPSAYEFVLKELTRKAILGTLPAGCNGSPSSYQKKVAPAFSTRNDYSEDKERWIAP